MNEPGMRQAILLSLLAFSMSVAMAAPVQVTAYTEAYCPDCKLWSIQQLQTAYKAPGVAEIMNITLVPFGNAIETIRNGSYVFACQHGPKECQANMFQACAMALNGYTFANYWPFVHCMDSSKEPVTAAAGCAKATGQSWEAIEQCSISQKGNLIMHQMAVATKSLVPPHRYVPWVTIDGEHSVEAENKLLSAVCRAYKGGQLPPGCR